MRTARRQAAEALLRFIDGSPTPWHATAAVAEQLVSAGFRRLDEADQWPALKHGEGAFVVRDDSSIIAFRIGQPDGGFRAVGAHTDSPGFRVKPRAASAREGLIGLAVEVYGSPIIPSFADRELTLAGRVVVRGPDGLATRLVNFGRALMRLPSPAIHLNRDVNEQGLRFEPQDELRLILGTAAEQLPADEEFGRMLADRLQVEAADVLSWELATADVQPGAFFGAQDEFIASARLDNLASCHAAVNALAAAPAARDTQIVALFDHEEVGSQSYKGADGSFLLDVIVRIAAALGNDNDSDRRRMLARSLLLSADMAHAVHPNFLRYYDLQHAVRLNGGPVIKINAKQRYATDAVGEAYFAALCEAAEVPCQKYVHRNNLPCGSTIGPIAAARLGVRTIDVGNPMWSMHSARESAGADDHGMLIDVLTRFYGDAHVPGRL